MPPGKNYLSKKAGYLINKMIYVNWLFNITVAACVDGIAGPRTLKALRLTGTARAARQRRGREVTSHRKVTILPPATPAGAAAPRTLSTPAAVPPSTQRSGALHPIVGSLALLIMASSRWRTSGSAGATPPARRVPPGVNGSYRRCP